MSQPQTKPVNFAIIFKTDNEINDFSHKSKGQLGHECERICFVRVWA